MGEPKDCFMTKIRLLSPVLLSFCLAAQDPGSGDLTTFRHTLPPDPQDRLPAEGTPKTAPLPTLGAAETHKNANPLSANG